jgi:hypothetical protein
MNTIYTKKDRLQDDINQLEDWLQNKAYNMPGHMVALKAQALREKREELELLTKPQPDNK